VSGAARHRLIRRLYATKVAAPAVALALGDDPEALEAACVLIEEVTIHPPETDDDSPGMGRLAS
jgi:hypothetical protein